MHAIKEDIELARESEIHRERPEGEMTNGYLVLFLCYRSTERLNRFFSESWVLDHATHSSLCSLQLDRLILTIARYYLISQGHMYWRRTRCSWGPWHVACRWWLCRRISSASGLNTEPATHGMQLAWLKGVWDDWLSKSQEMISSTEQCCNYLGFFLPCSWLWPSGGTYNYLRHY